MVDQAMKRAPILTIATIMVAAAPALSFAHDYSVLLSRALDGWSSANRVGIAGDVRSGLVTEGTRAVEEVHRHLPDVPISRLQELVLTAVTIYLDNTQQKGRSLKVVDLLEDLASSNITEVATSVVGPFNEYPILTVEVRPVPPADFVVFINGSGYQAGFNVFRVTEGEKEIRIMRTNRPPCLSKITVTKSGPNRITCQM